MRIKAFSLFLAIQVVSFSVWHTFYRVDASTDFNHGQVIHVEHSHHNHDHSHDHHVLSPAAETPFVVDFSARSLEEDYETLYESQREQIEKVLAWLPQDHRESVKDITLNYAEDAPRGLGGLGRVILGSGDMEEKELLAVFIHEVGHNVAWNLKSDEEGEDSPFYDGKTPLQENDPIVEFFRISWVDTDTKVLSSTPMDFVTKYGQTNIHEDFAESFIFYVSQGATFRSLSEFNKRLAAKYNFLRDNVFNGVEFETGEDTQNKLLRRWDTTKMDYDASLLWDAA